MEFETSLNVDDETETESFPDETSLQSIKETLAAKRQLLHDLKYETERKYRDIFHKPESEINGMDPDHLVVYV